jgi:cytochrome c553
LIIIKARANNPAHCVEICTHLHRERVDSVFPIDVGNVAAGILLTTTSQRKIAMNLFRSCILGNSALFLCTLLWLNPLMAADIEAGKQRASACFGCHGPEGISLNPKYPNLA